MTTLRLTNVPSAEPLTQRTQRIGNVSVFRCSGEIGYDEEEQLRSAISNQSRSGSLVLDFAEARVLDSTWLGALVTAAAHATASGVQLKLMNLHPSVEAVLRQNNLVAAFEICSPAEVISLWCAALRSRNREL
jgi:anti-anti-sigma factor